MTAQSTSEVKATEGANSSDKRQRILAAAEEIISQKGLADSSIAEVAQKAGVADPVIYQYFRGKQDLLFAIPCEHIRDGIKSLERQLKGISDPISRLRKMIWFHLNYNDSHRSYSRLLLLECRSSQDFYKSEAYKLIRIYSGVLHGILEDGVKEGLFREDMDIRVARDVILGALDMEIIHCLGSQEVESCEPDFDELVDLCLAMVMAPPALSTRARVKKAEIITNAAIQVFGEKGFNKAKISEIADVAGVGDGTVYEYFASKEALLLSIPTKRFPEYLDRLSGAFEVRQPLQRLRRLIKYHYSSFLADRQFLKMFLLELQLHRRFYGSEGFEEFKKYFTLFEEVVAQGQELNCFRKEVNTRIFRNMFLGAFSHMALRWLIVHDSTDTDKMKEIDEVTDMLTLAVLDHEAEVAGEDNVIKNNRRNNK